MAGKESVGEGLSKQLSNLVSALMHLAPSRNYVTQFLYVIKMNGSVEYRILDEAYPEIVKDGYVREAFAKAFGVSFKDKVTLEAGKYGEYLTDFIGKIFMLFEDPEFRTKASSILKEEYPQGIPNLAEEWLDVRLKALSLEPTYGKDSIKVLKEIARVGRAKAEDLEKALNIGRGNLFESLRLLKIYGLITEDYYGYTPSESVRKYPKTLEEIQA